MIFLIRCMSSGGETAATDSTGPDSFDVRTTGTWDFSRIQPRPYLPSELDYPSTEAEQVTFAWNEFLALNWKSSYASDSIRDNPDQNWNYSQRPEPYPPLVVWETFAHRTELRPASDKMLHFDAPPHYSFGDSNNIVPATPNTDFKLFDNLDENNEIGSCDVYGQVGATGKKDVMVLYQAKCNREEYDYLYKYFPNKNALKTGTKNLHDNIFKYGAYFPGDTSACGISPDTKVLCLPCGRKGDFGPETPKGAVEVKTAWRELRPDEDATRFFVRNVIVYKKSADGKKFVYENKNYALIGLHIIHKTENYPNFIFASFEHVDVQQQNMGYVELNKKGNEQGLLVARYPRLHPISQIADASTEYVHSLLARKNKASIWQNYRLVGVQTRPTDDTAAFNFYLANYVIESDPALASFHGSGLDTPFNKGKNILFGKKFYSMGGCQGCHGVAQIQLGGDGSFLMDDVGKPVDSPDIGIHDKLQRYLNAFKKIRMQDEALLKQVH